MNVSRETFLDSLNNIKSNSAFGGIAISGYDVLSLLLSSWSGVCVVVDDDLFDSVFSILYKEVLPGFVVLTNRVFSSPLGFGSSLSRYKNNTSSLVGDFSGVCLVDRSTYKKGCVDVYSKSKNFTLDPFVDYDLLVSALKEAAYDRVSVVSSPGEFSVRGSVVDFFSKEHPFPVRVDFSFKTAAIYLFNVSSQITTKKISWFSFVVSLGGLSEVSLSSLVQPLDLLFLVPGSLSWNSSLQSSVGVSSCYYDEYGSFSGEVFIDKTLLSFGVLVDGVLYAPPFFKEPNMQGFQKKISSSVLSGVGDIGVGDYLIHEDYGVGVLNNILSSESGEDSSLQISFLDAKITIHISQMNLISFFAKKGSLGVTVASISKKGLWLRRRQSVLNKIDSFVNSLYKQHLLRMSTTKKRDDIDRGLLSDFVAAFKHVDTKDQATAFQEILEDFSSPVPMDRLLCGDVGFGKTELAIRAAFISANQGSPVIVLCPTTVLCHQLSASFKDRLAEFSINTDSVSRLSSSSAVARAVDDFNAKKVDVLVCTHRIFSYLDSLKQVGLLVVDEEHRFGVKQKDFFLSTFPNIDVLMMSATPIPRTLQSALSGIKTISTITTPPIDRKPIETHVEFFDLNRIADYINFEFSRNGQVYFLHNNISSLNKFKRQLSSLVDGIKVEIIHAKMTPLKIKSVLRSFILKEFDVLVSTSIIENGLDIPNVNTVIINNAHLFGLSQLHQIRGRVGRHNRQAYAHLLIPKKQQPTGDTYRRLKAIEQNISLGSGYVLSTKDLEIRGAGSVFGYSQSGGAQVGFDYYNKLLRRSVSLNELGLSFDQVSINVFGEEAVLPTSYIKDAVVRLSIYRRLLCVDSFVSLKSFELELSNRFGVFPKETSLLLGSQELRILCFEVFVLSASFSKGSVSMVFLPSKFLDNISSFFVGVSSFFDQRSVKYKFQKLANDRLLLSFDWCDKNKDILVFLRNFLNKFKSGFIN